MRVLVLGGRAPVALDHVRRYSTQGWKAYAADSGPCQLTASSRHVTEAFPLPSPRHELPAFRAALNNIILENKIDVVLPTCEEVFFISRIRSHLPAQCNVFAPAFDVLRDLHSKWSFLKIAAASGFGVPDSALVSTLNEAREWSQGRAVVLKPEFSRFGVHVRIYPSGIPDQAPRLPDLGSWVAQEMCFGTEVCSYSVAVEGELRAHLVYRPRYRLATSSSYYFEHFPVPGIEPLVRGLIARLGFTGQICFDWMVGNEGALSVLECNPRAISGLHLFDDSARLPAAIAGEMLDTIHVTQPQPCMLGALMLGVALPIAMKELRVRQWYSDWKRAKDVLRIPGDSKPLIGAMSDIAGIAGISRKKRCSLRAAATQDIEWHGESLNV